MLDITLPNFLYLFIQYVVVASVIIILIVKTVRRFKINSVTLPFYFFSAFIVLWALLVFFHRIEENEIKAIALFKIVGVIYPYIYGFYFLTFLNIWKTRLLNLLCLVPSLVGSLLIGLYVDYGVRSGAFGWSYYQKQTGKPLIDDLIYSTTIIIIVILVFTLIYLLIKSPSRELKRKFLYILLAFLLFQVLGISITNLLFLQSNTDFPPLGGLFHLANIFVIYYQIQPPKKKVIFMQETGIYKPKMLTETIKAFYENLSPPFDTLGVKYFKFLSYLRECGLAETVKLEKDEIKFTNKEEEPISSSQIIRFINLSLTLMENNELNQKFSDNLINFINENYEKISEDLIVLFKKHEDYLKGSTIINKVAEGDLRLIFAPRNFTEEDLERFSKALNINHTELRNTPILLKFSSEKDFASKVEDYVREGFANGEEVHVFTRKESLIKSKLKNYKGINYLYLTPSISTISKISENEKMIPTGDISQLLGTLIAIKNKGKNASVIFDNLTDLIFLIGFDQTYKMTRHALDIEADSKMHSLFLINKDAHKKDVLSTFETLFKVVIP
ncbi:MAG: hypothetical protein QXJ17_02445 [Nitrososphaeria archaeon]